MKNYFPIQPNNINEFFNYFSFSHSECGLDMVQISNGERKIKSKRKRKEKRKN